MRPTPDNIIFIGMPGSGKSTLGVLYAKAEMYSFCDTDLFVQREEKLPLFKIIEKKGLGGFLEAEARVVSGIRDLHRTVIATGGSVVLSNEAMKNLQRLGTLIYLQLPCEEVLRRVRNIKTRGIVMKEGETLEDIYRERAPLYEKYADITVNCAGLETEESLEKIIEAVKEARNRK
ncbi:MAG: shikimate kinase [Clostridia bacterium]|nr:shikimate kinase [Clostridia bacterium]